MHTLIFLLLVLGLVGLSWLKRSPPGQRTRVRNQILMLGALALLLVMVVRGGLHPLIAGIGALMSFVVAAVVQQITRQVSAGVGQWAEDEEGGHAGRVSTVRTRFLHAYLDHDSGEMDAEVVAGGFRGRRLSELDLVQHRTLLQEIGADSQSRALLEAYLDRVHGPEWSQGPRASDGPGAGTMTEAEAREVLGVDAAAGHEEIVAAHRRLMQRLHPDRGGSTYLAAKINQAKRRLLEHGSSS